LLKARPTALLSKRNITSLADRTVDIPEQVLYYYLTTEEETVVNHQLNDGKHSIQAYVGLITKPHYLYTDMYVVCVNYIKRFQTVRVVKNKTSLLSKPVRYATDISKKTKAGSIYEYRNSASKYSATLAFGSLAASHVIKT